MTRTRERFMKSTVESSSQSVFMKNVKSLNTEFVNNIKHQKKYSFNVIFFSSKSWKISCLKNNRSSLETKQLIEMNEQKNGDKKKRKRNRDRDRGKRRENQNADS